MKKVKLSISMVFGPIPNIHSLLVVTIYIMRTGNRMRICKKLPYKYPTTRSHFDLLKANRTEWDRVGGTIDMLDFAFLI